MLKKFAFIFALPELLLSLPTGSAVASGSAEFSSTGSNLLEIIATDQTLIDWASFSIGADEQVRFSLPNANSVIVNQVLGSHSSEISGSLISNGQVVLLNPNGIVFGKDCRIDTGSLIAATLDLNREVFFAKNGLRFSGESLASILNEGSLCAKSGAIQLIGRQIDHRGLIDAEGSVSLLGAGEYRDAHPGAGIDSVAPLSYLQVSGVIRNEGGKVSLLSEMIDIQPGAFIDASSTQGAGAIFVGGGVNGADPLLPNAKWTCVAEGASLFANGLKDSSGGTIVVWGTEQSLMFGRMEALGGPLGGNGGFLEVSGGFLDFQGTVSAAAPMGIAGNLLLDPLDISITGGVTTVIPTGSCPGVGFVYTAGAGACISGCPSACVPGGSILNAATLAGNLGTCNVTVTTNGSAMGCTGNILVTSPVIWASAFNLTLDTSGTSGGITILTNIQNSGSGGVFLNSNTGTVQIGSNLAVASASVGSNLGPTVINAPNATVDILQGSFVISTVSQLGFYTPALGTSAGAISVTCNQLNLIPGNNNTSSRIGHGQPNSANINTSTTAAATITVAVQGDILLNVRNITPMIGSAGASAIIGHGTPTYDSTIAPAPVNEGDISVISNAGSITLSTESLASNSHVRIGHGPFFPQVAGVTANLPSMSGNITVRALSGDITLISTSLAADHTNIAHGEQRCPAASVAGDIEIVCGGDLTLSSLFQSDTITIGQTMSAGVNPITSVDQNIRVTVGNDILIEQSNFTVIGLFIDNSSAVGSSLSLTGDVEIIAGRDIALTTNHALPGFTYLGLRGVPVLGGPATIDGTPYIAAGRDITANATGATIFFEGPGNANFAAGRDITLTTSVAGPVRVSMQTRNNSTAVVNPTCRIRACGNILATNAFMGGATIAPSSYNIEIRAAGDIQMNNNLSTALGSILVEADADLPASALWGYTGSNLTSVCNQAFNPLLPITFTSLLPSPINTASTACAADQFGALRFVTVNPLNIVSFGTTSGNLTLHSACRQVNGTFQDLNVGVVGITTPGTATLTTTSGNVEIAGSIPEDGFHDITLTSVVDPWTSGTIYARACNDLNQNTVVHTTGLGNFITLISDSDADGSGNLNLTQNVTSNNGPILLDAGFATPTGSSSILQTGGQISSTGNSVTAQAVFNINFSGTSPVTLTTGGGPLSVASTVGTISIDEDILTSGGDAVFTAGLDILVNPPGGTSIAGGSAGTAGGDLSLFANNHIIVNGDPISLSSAIGAILAIADADNTGVGNLIINQTINSTTGNICCAAGPGTFGCSQNNCQSGLISGFPIGSCLVHINGGSVTSTTGAITITSAEDIIVNGLSPSVSTAGSIAMTAGLGDLAILQQVISTASSIATFAGNNTTLTQGAAPLLISSLSELRMITGLDMTFNPNAAIASSAGQVTLVVDNLHPSQPVFPAAFTGRFFMDKNTSVASGPGLPLRIFTAYSEVFGVGPGINFLDTEPALLNGISPALSGLGYPTTPFNDTLYEQWCVFFGCPDNYPSPNLGIPFTFFYKICIQLLVQQAAVIADQLLVSLHPYNEFPGWEAQFWLNYTPAADMNSSTSSLNSLLDEPYMLRRRQLNLLNHPKTYTQLVPE